MTTVTWRDLRENLADIINRVRYANERVQITRHGKVVAEIRPPEPTRSVTAIDLLFDSAPVESGYEQRP